MSGGQDRCHVAFQPIGPALVVGGSGQIGGWLLESLARRGLPAVGTHQTTPAPGTVPLDLGDAQSVEALLVELRPPLIFLPAGFTWVDGCERDPVRCDAANRREPIRLARLASRIVPEVRVIHFSTDYVFDGARGPDDEEAIPNPLSEYGRAKLAAERELTELLGERLLIIRTTWVFGPERQGKNFAYQVARTLREGKPLVCPSDQISNPTYSPDLADAVVELALRSAHGLLHLAGPDRLPRCEFARRLAQGLNLDPTPIQSKPTAELGQTARRPLNGGLVSRRLSTWFPNHHPIRPLDQAVADFRATAKPPWRDPLTD